jgi:hypothetical protein
LAKYPIREALATFRTLGKCLRFLTLVKDFYLSDVPLKVDFLANAHKVIRLSAIKLAMHLKTFMEVVNYNKCGSWVPKLKPTQKGFFLY